MEKLKNVRRGMLVIADAGLKLTPGQTVEVETLTRQMEALLASGHLIRAGKKAAAPQQTEMTEASDLSKMTTQEAIASIGEMDDQRVVSRPSFRHEDLLHGRGVHRVGPKAVDRLGRERGDRSSSDVGGSLFDRIGDDGLHRPARTQSTMLGFGVVRREDLRPLKTVPTNRSAAPSMWSAVRLRMRGPVVLRRKANPRRPEFHPAPA